VQLSDTTTSFCRPGDIGGAPCGGCGCEEAKDPAKCKKAVDDCKAHSVSSKSMECTFVTAELDPKLRVGAVCDGKAKEFSAGKNYGAFSR
jgi:hypothetical protein